MLTHIVHDTCYGASIVLNGLLITLILTRTPAYLKCYSIVLLYLSIVELSTAMASLLVFKKVMSTYEHSINAVAGPCRNWGSPSVCYYLNCVQLAGISHYGVLIAFCSCYRYYVISRSRSEPKSRNVVLALFAAHLPTVAIYVKCALMPLMDREETEQVMKESLPFYDLEKNRDKELLLVTRMDWLSHNWIQFIIVPVCVVVLTCSVRINAILASVDHMSVKSKQRHAHILKGLLCQATLPAIYAIAVVVYRAERHNLGTEESSKEMGHLTPMLASVMTALSPLFTIIFTMPYKDALKSAISKKQSTESSITSQTPIVTFMKGRSTSASDDTC